MKDKLIKAALSFAVVCVLGACTKNYLDINSNPYEVDKEQMEAKDYAIASGLSAMFGTVVSTDVNTAQFTDCLLGSTQGGYYADANNGWTNTISKYNPTDNWTNVFMYSDKVIPQLYSNMSNVEGISEDPLVLAILKIVKVCVLNRVTDTYGPIPYSEIGSTGKIQVAYDDQPKVYSQMFDELDEAIALPTDFSARIARNTQIYIQEETQICKNVDPWGGSYYVEALTNELAHKAWEHIQEIEKLGGMAKAIETGIPKMRIEEAAARTQARIDSGEQTIVGTNKYRLEKEDPIDILEVDNTAVRQEQIENLRRLREGRNQAEVDKALEAITECVRTGKGNLLELAVEAARVRATLGEISDACEKVVGRYKAVIRTISGVYSSESKKDADFARACELTEEFAKKEGRRPRVMIAKMGQDGHDRGAKVVATGFADCGFDVDMGPLFQTPEEAAREAVENDVHAVGVSSLAAGHKTLIPQIIAELKRLGREDILVFAGGVIPAQDYDFLYKAGVMAIFGPGTSVAKSACQVMELLLENTED